MTKSYFQPTHIIKVSTIAGDYTDVVQLMGSLGYTKDDLEHREPSQWTVKDGKWVSRYPMGAGDVVTVIDWADR